MLLKCVAIDDELPALMLMQKYIGDHPLLELQQRFTDAVSASEYLKATAVDLLFVDINMPDITGLDLVRSLNDPPMIIFTTAYKKFAIDGFELDAVDYLLKPISFERFSKAVNKAAEYHRYKTRTVDAGESLMVFSEYQLVKINCSDIEYIESMGDYIRIHQTTDKPVMSLMTLKAVLDKLPASVFKRIHRSYIVNTDKIRSVISRKVKLSSGTELPVSDSYLDVVKAWKQV